jgi:hypothetical protein
MVSDKLYLHNKTNDSKIYVLIGHLLHYTDEGVMAPELLTKHRVDDKPKFLTTLIK